MHKRDRRAPIALFARHRLRKILLEEVNGKRTCVLILGDGVNCQAAGKRPGNLGNDWHKLLRRIWREAGGSRTGFDPSQHSAAASCSVLGMQWATHHGVNQSNAVKAVRRRLLAGIARLETTKSKRRLLTKLMDGRFANVISLSVDRRLLLQAGARRVVARKTGDDFLYRYHEVMGSRGHTKVWYPYGDSSRAQSIELEDHRYDERLVKLEAYRASLMETFNQYEYGYGPGLREPNYIYRSRWRAPVSWCDLFFSAPLVFIGTSLPADDWPLWWLLHQRVRYFVAFERREVPATFYLTTRHAEIPHIENGAAGIEVVRFADYAGLWKFVLEALEARGGELEDDMD